MKRIKLTALCLTAVLAAASFSGCSEKAGTSQEATEVSEAVTEAVTERELTQEQKDAAAEAGISEDRYCTDNAEITKKAEEILKIYYEGITEADHDKCLGVFPDFYKKAIEKDNEEYNETNEEYMHSIRQGIIDQYGDDFYVFPTVTSVLQINDESLDSLEKRIASAFDTEIKLDDLYYVYFTETRRGSLDKSTNPMEFSILVEDGKYYLYDTYFERGEEN